MALRAACQPILKTALMNSYLFSRLVEDCQPSGVLQIAGQPSWTLRALKKPIAPVYCVLLAPDYLISARCI